MISDKQYFRRPKTSSILRGAIYLSVFSFGFSSLAHSQTENSEPQETPSINKSTDAKGQIANSPTTAPADLAFGAFQRGQYLTAFELALPRANLGDPAAQTLIAEIYDRGLGVAQDRKEAATWYEIAANAGNREAQFSFAVKLLDGKYIKQDHPRAMKLMRAAAEAGHSVAMYNYAQQLISDNPGSKGFTAAFPYLEKSADAGVVDAYYALSQIYGTGMGIATSDSEKARHWLVKAAKGGVDTAQIELAIQLANGKGGEKDEKSAIAWFRRAAFRGNVIAQNRLAHMLARGMGETADAVKAAKWYVLARRAGHVDLWLDEFFGSISKEDRAKALDAANHWRAR